MLVQVAIARKLPDHRDCFTYRVPEVLQSLIHWGSLVLVPVGRGNQQVNGYVTGYLEENGQTEYKEILEVLEPETLLTQELVELAVWMSTYYLCPCYYILTYMLPKFARSKMQEMVVWADESELAQATIALLEPEVAALANIIRQKKTVAHTVLKKTYPQMDVDALLQQLQQAGLVRRSVVFQRQGSSKIASVYESCLEPAQLEEARKKLGRAVRQWELLRYLTYEGPTDGKGLCQYWPNYGGLTRVLIQKGLIRRRQVQMQRFHDETAVFHNEKTLTLNAEQQHALDVIVSSIDRMMGEIILLHGVTGSGKTEVYLRAIRHVLEQGNGAMVLVPEIALTPQLIGRFRAVLGEYVEVLHSNMSDGERFDAWQRLRKGETRVVVGVRSAVFAPIQNLRLIIMDEEHETTFKQSEPDPRYHAREVAKQRMQYNHGLLLLGSATPSVKTYYEIQQGGGTLLTMEQRAQQQPLPEVQVVNMAHEFQNGNRSMFSSVLIQTMEDSLRNGEQVILFLNRRGFSSSIVCRECGYTLTCEKCSIALTYHKEQELAKCHYCDYRTPTPKQCPHCGSRFIRYMGAGTELVAEELKKMWPWVTADRMDLDTTQNKDAHSQILERFARGETQVLIGTQMVAKGLDFPNVTAVGVLAADMILNLPDYTAAERTFQLLTQVAGRAGRGDKPGRVIVQTYNPEHYSILAAQDHDYRRFYQKEIQVRALMDYPPFCYMIRILVSDYHVEGILELLQKAADGVAEKYPDIRLLGPSEAPVGMVRKRHRFHLILKGKCLDSLREAAEYGQTLMNLSRKSKTLRILIDVEPSSVL